MRKLAADHGGLCLSTEYKNNHTKLSWQCCKGHKWEAVPNSVKQGGTWCPQCPLKSEQECRSKFESLIGKPFPKCRPKWLEGLELDGFCEDYRIAFEYNGRQHYQVVDGWHENGIIDLQDQQKRDAKKADLCEANWVTLIVIPFDMDDQQTFVAQSLYALIAGV